MIKTVTEMKNTSVHNAVLHLMEHDKIPRKTCLENKRTQYVILNNEK